MEGGKHAMKSYRVLLVTSDLYRTWAKARCRQLDTWAKAWCPDGSLSAGPGLGAADGHYELAIRVEHAVTFAHMLGGGVTDLAHCFDRVLLDIVTLSPKSWVSY